MSEAITLPSMLLEMVIRPERVLVGPEADRAENQAEGVLTDISYVGDSSKYRVALMSGEILTSRVQNRRGTKLAVTPGARLSVGWDPEDVIVFAKSNKP
jgi:ABC-type Fe3+/spermidine/putrescine transport system ATPase subunit